MNWKPDFAKIVDSCRRRPRGAVRRCRPRRRHRCRAPGLLQRRALSPGQRGARRQRRQRPLGGLLALQQRTDQRVQRLVVEDQPHLGALVQAEFASPTALRRLARRRLALAQPQRGDERGIGRRAQRRRRLACRRRLRRHAPGGARPRCFRCTLRGRLAGVSADRSSRRCSASRARIQTRRVSSRWCVCDSICSDSCRRSSSAS